MIRIPPNATDFTIFLTLRVYPVQPLAKIQQQQRSKFAPPVLSIVARPPPQNASFGVGIAATREASTEVARCDAMMIGAPRRSPTARRGDSIFRLPGVPSFPLAAAATPAASACTPSSLLGAHKVIHRQRPDAPQRRLQHIRDQRRQLRRLPLLQPPLRQHRQQHMLAASRPLRAAKLAAPGAAIGCDNYHVSGFRPSRTLLI